MDTADLIKWADGILPSVEELVAAEEIATVEEVELPLIQATEESNTVPVTVPPEDQPILVVPLGTSNTIEEATESAASKQLLPLDKNPTLGRGSTPCYVRPSHVVYTPLYPHRPCFGDRIDHGFIPILPPPRKNLRQQIELRHQFRGHPGRAHVFISNETYLLTISNEYTHSANDDRIVQLHCTPAPSVLELQVADGVIKTFGLGKPLPQEVESHLSIDIYDFPPVADHRDRIVVSNNYYNIRQQPDLEHAERGPYHRSLIQRHNGDHLFVFKHPHNRTLGDGTKTTKFVFEVRLLPGRTTPIPLAYQAGTNLFAGDWYQKIFLADLVLGVQTKSQETSTRDEGIPLGIHGGTQTDNSADVATLKEELLAEEHLLKEFLEHPNSYCYTCLAYKYKTQINGRLCTCVPPLPEIPRNYSRDLHLQFPRLVKSREWKEIKGTAEGEGSSASRAFKSQEDRLRVPLLAPSNLPWDLLPDYKINDLPVQRRVPTPLILREQKLKEPPKRSKQQKLLSKPELPPPLRQPSKLRARTRKGLTSSEMQTETSTKTS